MRQIRQTFDYLLSCKKHNLIFSSPYPLTTMKTTNILYWVFTGIFAAMMLLSAIPNVMMSEDSIALIHTLLGYPKYFIMIVGVAKIFGVVGILIPGYPTIKEWAYAGLFFDLLAATASVIAVEGFKAQHLGMAIFIIPGILSYYFYRKRLKLETQSQTVR